MSGAAIQVARTPRLTRDTVSAILRPALIFIALALVPLLAKLLSAQYLLDLGSRVMIFAVAAVALDLIVGYGGLVSFGHAGFIGLGAYAVGILSAEGFGDVLLSLPIAVGASMLFALATALSACVPVASISL